MDDGDNCNVNCNVNLERVNEMISDPRNLTLLVVQKVLDYKDELRKLLLENKRMEKEINHLKHLLTLTENEKSLLGQNVSTSNNRIRELIELMNTKNICSSCYHSLECGDSFLCAYCQKYVCNCCRIFCTSKDHHSNNSNNNNSKCNNCSGFENLCIFSMCTECSEHYRETCPKHNEDMTFEEKEELIQYFMKNRYRKPVP